MKGAALSLQLGTQSDTSRERSRCARQRQLLAPHCLRLIPNFHEGRQRWDLFGPTQYASAAIDRWPFAKPTDGQVLAGTNYSWAIALFSGNRFTR